MTTFLGDFTSFEGIRSILIGVLVIAALALVFAFILSSLVEKVDEGTDRMKDISLNMSLPTSYSRISHIYQN